MHTFHVPTRIKNSFSIAVPGSKSLTNRYLLLAALANGTSILHRPLSSDDTEVMKSALKSLGTEIQEEEHAITIKGCNGKWPKTPESIYLQNAGTAVRFLTAASFLAKGPLIITGNKRMQERPIKDLIEGLKTIGLHIKHTNNCPPLHIHSEGKFPGGTIHIEGGKSSQYISALLLVAPFAQKETYIIVENEIVSKPYLDLTIQALEHFGVTVSHKKYQSFHIKPTELHGATIDIEADASSATYFYGIAALHGSTATVTNATRKSLQADTHFLDVIGKMGAVVTEEDGIQVHGPKQLEPLGTIDLNHMPDSAMTVAVLATAAKGTTHITNIGNLRIKETDRIEALQNELKKVGVETESTNDSLTVHGNPDNLKGATIETYDDHRMAMCFAMLGTKIPDMIISDPECSSKTYPTFWNDLMSIAA